MRVIWLTPGFPADENDHNCIPPLQQLAHELVARGIDLQVIALEYPFRGKPYHWNGIPVWPCNGRNRFWRKLRTLRRAFRQGQQLLNARPAILHSFWQTWAAQTGARLSYRTGAPHLTTLMGQDVLPVNHRHLKYLSQHNEPRLVALSAFHGSALEKTTGLRAAHIIPWGIREADIPKILPESRPLDVLGVGSLLPVKNWARWLRVLRRVADRIPGLQAELIGDGPERGRLQSLCKRLELEKNLRFGGTMPREQVLQKMRSAKVLLHSADFESFGFVLAEAAAQGCRVVSTPVGIAPELGFAAGSDEALAEAVVAGLGHAAEIQAPLLMSETAERYVALYELYQGLSGSGSHG